MWWKVETKELSEKESAFFLKGIKNKKVEAESVLNMT